MTTPQCFRLRPASGPIQELDCMHDWDWRTGGELRDATDVGRQDHLRFGRLQVAELAIAQLMPALKQPAID